MRLFLIAIVSAAVIIGCAQPKEAQSQDQAQQLQVPNGTIQVPALVPGVALVPAVPALGRCVGGRCGVPVVAVYRGVGWGPRRAYRDVHGRVVIRGRQWWW